MTCCHCSLLPAGQGHDRQGRHRQPSDNRRPAAPRESVVSCRMAHLPIAIWPRYVTERGGGALIMVLSNVERQRRNRARVKDGKTPVRYRRPSDNRRPAVPRESVVSCRMDHLPIAIRPRYVTERSGGALIMVLSNVERQRRSRARVKDGKTPVRYRRPSDNRRPAVPRESVVSCRMAHLPIAIRPRYVTGRSGGA